MSLKTGPVVSARDFAVEASRLAKRFPSKRRGRSLYRRTCILLCEALFLLGIFLIFVPKMYSQSTSSTARSPPPNAISPHSSECADAPPPADLQDLVRGSTSDKYVKFRTAYCSYLTTAAIVADPNLPWDRRKAAALLCHRERHIYNDMAVRVPHLIRKETSLPLELPARPCLLPLVLEAR
jgi:hypothetical protein